jgi:hypothetical protein
MAVLNKILFIAALLAHSGLLVFSGYHIYNDGFIFSNGQNKGLCDELWISICIQTISYLLICLYGWTFSIWYLMCNLVCDSDSMLPTFKLSTMILLVCIIAENVWEIWLFLIKNRKCYSNYQINYPDLWTVFNVQVLSFLSMVGIMVIVIMVKLICRSKCCFKKNNNNDRQDEEIVRDSMYQKI